MAEVCLSIRFCTDAEEEVICYPRRKKPKTVYKIRDKNYMIQNGKKYKLSCDKQKTLSRMFKSEGQEKLSKNPDFAARVEK